MNWVRPGLAVGAFRDASNADFLVANEVGAVLQLAAPTPHAGIAVLYLPIEDGEPISAETFRAGLDFVQEQHDAERKVLIACGLGISRSATFATASLKEAEGLPLLEAFRAVKAAQPEARPHPVLWASLCRYYDEPTHYREMLRIYTTPRQISQGK